MPHLSLLALAILLCTLSAPIARGTHQMEHLDRGLVGLRVNDSQALLSWRLLATDPVDTRFLLYRSTDGEPPIRITPQPLDGPTQFTDSGADLGRDNRWYIRPIHGGIGQDLSRPFPMPANTSQDPYFLMPLDKPADVEDPIAGHYSYSANDCSVADLDGDGQYELILKWEPSNAKDNAHSGFTGDVLLDAYEFDGTRLWRINLGPNIRAGAHYTQFIVYDFDGDGRAELACKTADGSVSGTGETIGDPTADHRNPAGYILQGPEFLTLFDGLDGSILAHTNYVPARGQVSRWGDNYGNRVDRFLAGVAYLDGVRPSLVMCRGYYTRTVLAAWDWRDGQLTQRWVFDSDQPGLGDFAGQGAHSLSIGDVDGDTRDEIVYGACVIDDDGSGLHSTGLGHGDALHLSDMDPSRPGLEVWMVHESPATYGDNGSALRDGTTGEILFGVNANSDVGRGVAADIDPRFPGHELWSSRANLHNIDGTQVSHTRPGPMNFLCWWDGDLLRELLDGTRVSKWNWNTEKTDTLLAPTGISSNNGTKATPCLSADIFGDWREEIIWRESDSRALRIYTSTIPTPHRIPTLMHDRTYRLSVAWQNVGYNQPPHPGFHLGEAMETAPRAEVQTPSPPDSPPPVDTRFPDWLAARGLAPYLSPDDDPDGNGRTLFDDYAFENDSGPPVSLHKTSEGFVFDFSTPRNELDYRVESSGDLESWSPVVTLATPSERRTEWTLPHGQPRRFYRVVAESIHGPAPVSTVYQAEDADYGGASLDDDHTGFFGTGFINSDLAGSHIQFTSIDGGSGGLAQLSFRFALGATAPRSGRLLINGTEQPITFPPTGAWNQWSVLNLTAELRPATQNTTRLETTGEDLANIDQLTVTPSP